MQSICRWTSLYSKINDKDKSNIDINNDLVKISRWALSVENVV